MASGNSTILINKMRVSSSTTGLFDVNGNPLDTVSIVGSELADLSNVAYSDKFVIPTKATDHVLVSVCVTGTGGIGCALTVKLEMSPDGINWCPCVDAQGLQCQNECDPLTGFACTSKVIESPVLQYVRVRVSNAGSDSDDGNGIDYFCTIRLNYSLE